MKSLNIKVRGIYTTALTQLFLDMGCEIVQPSREICERFQIPGNEVDEDVSIQDRDDRQGVRVFGEETLTEELIHRLWEVLLDMVVRRQHAEPDDSAGATREGIIYEIEFPGATKAVLDCMRARVLPTLMNHHRLRIIASDYLDLIEREIERAPHKQVKLEHELKDRFVYQPLRRQGLVRFEHVKPEGEALKLREGEIVSLESDKLVIERHFHMGRYDGLDLPIESGDYGITEVTQGSWFLRHRYFSKVGELRGEYYNVNTPIELYPDHIRYVDLHVDVVRRGKEAPKIIDQEKLESITRNGLISPRLQEKAIEVSYYLLDQLEQSD